MTGKRPLAWKKGGRCVPSILRLSGGIRVHPDIEAVLFTERQIAAKVAELGAMVSRDAGGRELYVVGVLKGAVIFMSDLVRRLEVPARIDFMAVSSYGASSQSSGVVRILKDLDEDLEGRHVLLVEDIVDTGLTLHYLAENLRARHPASLRLCAFLDKPTRRRVEVAVDYTGFTVPDQFIVGYGLDYAGRYRNLPYVGVLKPEVYRRG